MKKLALVAALLFGISGEAVAQGGGGIAVIHFPTTVGHCVKVVAPGGNNIGDAGAGCGGTGSPGGSSTQVQFNNAGSFGGVSGVISDGTSVTISSGDLKLSGSSSGTMILNAPATGGGTVTGPTGTTTLAAANNNLGFFAATTSAQLAGVLSDETGSGLAVFNNGAALIAPALGTIASGNLAAGTGYTLANLAGLGSGVGTALAITHDTTGGICTVGGSGCSGGSGNANFATATGNTIGDVVAMQTTGTGIADGGYVAASVGTGAVLSTSPATSTNDFNLYCKQFTINNSGINIPIPSAASLLTSGCFDIINPTTNTYTITPNLTDNLNGANSPVTIPGNSIVRVTSNGVADFVNVPSAGGSGLTIGTTTITSGTSGRSLYDNGGVVGERTVTGTGGDVLANNPTITGATFNGALGATPLYLSQVNGVTPVTFDTNTFKADDCPNGDIAYEVGRGDGGSARGYITCNGDLSFQSLQIGAGGLQVNGIGAINSPNYGSIGSPPTLTGSCPTASQTGGNQTGSFTASCSAQAVIITFAVAAAHGWFCEANDNTTLTDTLRQSDGGATPASCTLTGTTVSADRITFHAFSY